MAAKFCSKCGARLSYGDRFCSDCGHHVSGEPSGDVEATVRVEIKRKKKCPRCDGTGKCSAFDNMSGPAQAIMAVFTLGMYPTVHGIRQDSRCERCGGSGQIPLYDGGDA